MNIEILDKLIAEGEALTNTIEPDERRMLKDQQLSQSRAGYRSATTGNVKYYKTSNPNGYELWKQEVLRVVKNNCLSDLYEIKEALERLSKKNHSKILAFLRAIKSIPNEPKKMNTNKDSTPNISIINNQNVSQQLTLNVNVFLEAIKDGIPEEDFNALKEIMKDYEKKPEETKNKIVEKIKGFGGDVLSNIVANILTNPAIYEGLIKSLPI